MSVKDPLASAFDKSSHRKVFPHSVGITRLAYSRDGKYLFTVGSNSVVYRFKAGTDEQSKTMTLDRKKEEDEGKDDEEEEEEEEEGEGSNTKQYGIAANVSIHKSLNHEHVIIFFFLLTDQDKSFFIFSDSGRVDKYGIESMEFEGNVTRMALPVRDVSISSDSKWIAICGE